MQRFYQRLSQICHTRLLAEKYLIVPSYMAGQMVRQAAVEWDIPLLDLEVETLSGLVSSRTKEVLYDVDRELITDSRIRIMLLNIFRELREDDRLEYLSGLELTSGVLDVTATTVLELRLAGLGAEELKNREDEFVQAAKGRDMARIIERYEKNLADSGYVDRAGAIQLYLQEKTGGSNTDLHSSLQEEQYYLVPDSLDLAPLEEDFLEKLGEKAENSLITLPTPPVYNRETPDHYRNSHGEPEDSHIQEKVEQVLKVCRSAESGDLIDEETVEENSFNLFSYLFAVEELREEEKRLQKAGGEDSGQVQTLKKKRKENLHLHRAYGKSNEIRGVFRRIKENDIPLDRTAIFYTRQEPYCQLCYDLAGRLELPVTFGDGINIKNTRPGQLYFKLLDWIASDYSVKYMHRALLQKLIDPVEIEPFTPGEVAKILRRLKIGWRRERYEKLLAEEVEADASEGANTAAEAAQDLIQRLFSRLPAVEDDNMMNTGALAGGLSQVFEHIAAADAADSRQKSYEQEARNYIINRLSLISEHYQRREDLDRSLSRLEDIMEGSGIGASMPQPGHVHICSYREAQWLNRSHNYIVGLDAESFPGSQREDPILLDEEREKLGGLRLKSDTGKLKVYRLTQGLASLTGEINLSYSCFDTTDCSEIAPAPSFLQVYRLKTGDAEQDYGSLKESLEAVEEFVPAREEQLLTENSLWLRLGLKKIKKNKYGEHVQLAELAGELFPGFDRGHKAWNRRRNESFNPYCGEVSVNPEEVDPRKNQQVMSSSKLERMAKCPFKYFLENVLEIEEPEELEREPLEWLDAMERGSMLHSIYENFYREISQRGEKPDRNKHEKRLLEIAREKAEEYRRETPPPSEMVYEQEMREIFDSCRFFLASEAEHSQGREPFLFEFYFGRGRGASSKFKGGPARLKLPSGGEIKFSGIIDRVDRLDEGGCEVIDYKTGSTYVYSGSDYFKNGRQLQHALYALAVEKLARDDIQVTKSGYVFASRKGEGQRYMRESDGREKVKEIVEILAEALSQGVFPPSRYDWGDYTFCGICDFNEKICEREKKDELHKIWQNSDHKGIELLRRLESYE